MYGNTGLTSQFLQELTLATGEWPAAGAWCQDEFTDQFSLIGQRPTRERFPRFSIDSDHFEDRPLLHTNSDVGELEGMSYHLHKSWQDLLRSQCGFQALPQTGNHTIGIIALTKHQSIDGLLEVLTQRLENECDDARREQREEHIPLYPKERAKSDHHQHIQSNHTCSEYTVHQRAVDDEIDIPQAIAQNSHANADRRKHECQCGYELSNQQGEQMGIPSIGIWRREGLYQTLHQQETKRNRQAEHHPLRLLTFHLSRDPGIAIDLAQSADDPGTDPDHC